MEVRGEPEGDIGGAVGTVGGEGGGNQSTCQKFQLFKHCFIVQVKS